MGDGMSLMNLERYFVSSWRSAQTFCSPSFSTNKGNTHADAKGRRFWFDCFLVLLLQATEKDSRKIFRIDVMMLSLYDHSCNAMSILYLTLLVTPSSHAEISK